MDLSNEKEKNNYQTFSCGNAEVTFDNNGYVIKAKGFTSVMWGNPNLDEELIGKHIIEIAKTLKEYTANQRNYIIFLENVVLNFYEKNSKDTLTKDCSSCQNMSCRVESYEKPADNCVGFIHHDEKQEQPQIMSLTKKVGVKLQFRK